MATLKDAAENTKVALDVARGARRWASRSTARVLLLLSLVGVIVLAGQALYLNHLLQQSSEATQTYVKTERLLSDKLAYEAAIDAISACIESHSEITTLHKWYCTQADSQFKTRTRELKYPGAQEMFQLHAYLAMRDLMRNRVRGLALDQLVQPSDTSQGKTLTLVASKTGTLTAAILTALLMLGTFVYLVWLPKRQSEEGAIMKPQDFQRHFQSKIRVMLDWSKFISSDWSIELRYFSIPEQSSLVYTPWYAQPDGSACAYNSPNAMPQSVASVALNSALREHHKVGDAPHSESISVVPAYRLNGDSILLLDGNHRAVSSQAASTKLGLAAFVINGPIDEHVLPDLAHWV
ncbi:hypothetical protein [Dyella nitratireducens]|uniref:hypothetical protein n=1 Tax=Dyella nitratireducens TaxID=1849580 RepID=UPI0016649B93|nr:hypothetical protein [Dyella nitratireducens]